METDPALLSRIQFAANISFHILFPSLTIALGWFLLFFKLRYSATNNCAWMDAYFFWTKIFALSFAMGIVSGVTMSFQFGTNWPGFMQTVGNVAGPLLAYEVLTAFFLEATFLGIMLFGFRRVPQWMHTLATVLVAAGTTFSAFWILALNSWMQTPAGFTMIDGKAHVVDWFEAIFNPSFATRITHVLLASGLTAAFFVSGIAAWRLLRGDQKPEVMFSLRTGVAVAALLIPLQIFAGDQHGLNTLQYQPQKVAAMEGLWKTQARAPAVLFGLPNEREKRNDFAVEIPGAASLILTHSLDGEVKGIDAFPDNHPPVAPVFWSFRVMVGLGMAMLAVSWLAAFQSFCRRGKPHSKWLLNALFAMTFSGWFATLAGWYVTEIGRQPWLVTGVLKTADAVSKVPAPMVGFSLALYLAVYVVLLVAYVGTIFYLAKAAGDKPTSGIKSGPGKAVVKALAE
ncbi:MAG: cytochrome ubiquinol oxidase subunit I [Bdellovibrionales bacterium]